VIKLFYSLAGTIRWVDTVTFVLGSLVRASSWPVRGSRNLCRCRQHLGFLNGRIYCYRNIWMVSFLRRQRNSHKQL